ncbi:hypothetical protein A2V71_04105 [Candidatus Berkelbacteria bacterium RBG_13_40_8]|uniref:DUF3048 domain-containing protein n=1 Tax=Candidatus Berkelbacteria bacterium RBG_13_40_8 TaxID=1797467 RepID=A0A1F5DPC9_9BACT|nr:MAG: hypothetical protein A2V71_04105 [Candidatus Berkelbacteria bacterium RBG_13_40_8]
MDEKQKKKKKIKPLTIVLVAIFSLILGFAGFVIYKRYFEKEKFADLFKRGKEETLVANKLDGTLVPPDKATRHPLAIVIENHTQARPQVGLDKASIIYEVITEGGITRFLAVYGPYDAEKVGPVRSARTYFIDWLSEFNAYFGHVGGNYDALEKIKIDNILDLDQFALGKTAYWREPEKGKATEHTMFTTTEKLYQAAKDKKYPEKADFRALEFKEPLEEALRKEGQKITINFSSDTYSVSWLYDTATNKYLRTMGGLPHKDKASGEQLAAANIIIQQMERWEAPTEINETGWAMKTIGSDKAMVFSQGKQIIGTWKKTDRTSKTIFYDDKGKEITFIPGQFWIEIVPPDIFPNIKVEAITSSVTK